MKLPKRLLNYVAGFRAARVLRRGVPRGLGPAGQRGGVVLTLRRDRSPIAVGRLVVETRRVDPDTGVVGEWETQVDHSNLVVRQAENIMTQMAIGAANSALSYIELGDPTFPATPPQLADLTLQQSTGQRKSVVLTAVGNVVKAEATWLTTEGNGFTYTEAGLFNGVLGSGLMFARKVFNGITKTGAFELRFTWYITFLVNTQGGDCSGIALIGPSAISPYTIYISPTGGEASVAATFDFTVGSANVDVYLNGARLLPGNDYIEVGAGSLTAPVGGSPLNKGVNFVGFVLNAADEVFLIQHTTA